MISELKLKSKYVKEKHTEGGFLIVSHMTDYKCLSYFFFL